MTPILKFLLSLRNLQKSGVIKSVDEAYDFAKREFGEINDLLKRQIEQVFKTGKPAPKPGEGCITSIKNAPKKQESGIVDQIEASGKRLEGAANRMSEIQKEIDGKIIELDSATLEEIMQFEDMPTIKYEELLSNMKARFEIFYTNYTKVVQELDKLYKIKQNAKAQGAANIEENVDKLIYDMKMEEKKLHLGRRVFYNRLKDLDLLEEEYNNKTT